VRLLKNSFILTKLLLIFTKEGIDYMYKLFDIVFLEEAFDFLNNLDKKHSNKILYNIRKVQSGHDPELLKKLQDEIWEFRTLYRGTQYRMFAFRDKTDPHNSLVVSTQGIVKKQSKVSLNEIKRAYQIRKKYFEEKNQ